MNIEAILLFMYMLIVVMIGVVIVMFVMAKQSPVVVKYIIVIAGVLTVIDIICELL